jgi:hypothetical protein
MKWMATAHRDWTRRLDAAQFEIEADTREQAIEIAKYRLATGPVPWVVGDPVKRDEGFIVMGQDNEAGGP